MVTTAEIRSAFLSFFQKHGHALVESSSLIPHNDPTLLFTGAGMVPFKNVFTGAEKRAYVRAVTAQKCLRAGGKHNDLDNVGRTARHHTFFEMLGNFSFGDYFKPLAIELAWNLITREFALPLDRLLVTVYHEDEEAFSLWRKIAGLPESKILRIPTSDNFWAMGPTGPCGPCSEIFYDHGSHIPGGPPGSPDSEGDRFVEIWNLVFMQFEALPGVNGGEGERILLPRPSIDTGMGLERIAAVLQGTHDNYETDIMAALITASISASGEPSRDSHAVSHRVIADHIRAISFLIAEGILPSNEGRGYVLRRIIRRAIRHGHLLGKKDPFIWQLVPILVQQMGQAYPELKLAETFIIQTLRNEEERFHMTLVRGMHVLQENIQNLSKGELLPGHVAFKLYDTYGFPLDLTQEILKSSNLEVDAPGFEISMQQQKAEARKAWVGSGEKNTENIWFDILEKVGTTEFLGYVTQDTQVQVCMLIQDGKSVEALAQGTRGMIILNQTPFYAEAGGQVGDEGWLLAPDCRVQVIGTYKKVAGLVVHESLIEEGYLKVGTHVRAQINSIRRKAIARHHSATHLLHEALRQILGEHVVQRGSLVAPDRLRFDFAHPNPLTETEKEAIESLTNATIWENLPITTHFMRREEAQQSGARALFGEKYGAEVRVVQIGPHFDPERKAAFQEKLAFSKELCGGTHVQQTGELGCFLLLSESGVSSGVRRIEASVGESAHVLLVQERKALEQVASLLKTSRDQVTSRLKELLANHKRFERDLQKIQHAQVQGQALHLLVQGAHEGDHQGAAEKAKGDSQHNGLEKIGSITFAWQILPTLRPQDMKPLVENMKRQIGSGIVALMSGEGEQAPQKNLTETQAKEKKSAKISLVVGVTDDLTPQFNAVDMVQEATKILGGKGGGGRPDMAQGGGPEIMRCHEALKAIRDMVGRSSQEG